MSYKTSELKFTTKFPSNDGDFLGYFARGLGGSGGGGGGGGVDGYLLTACGAYDDLETTSDLSSVVGDVIRLPNQQNYTVTVYTNVLLDTPVAIYIVVSSCTPTLRTNCSGITSPFSNFHMIVKYDRSKLGCFTELPDDLDIIIPSGDGFFLLGEFGDYSLWEYYYTRTVGNKEWGFMITVSCSGGDITVISDPTVYTDGSGEVLASDINVVFDGIDSPSLEGIAVTTLNTTPINEVCGNSGNMGDVLIAIL